MREQIASLVAGRDLDAAAMEGAVETILRGEATPAQIGALLVALRMKGETVLELAAAARVMRCHAVPVRVTRPGIVLDTCGTGGDGSGSFNISTAAAIAVAAAGVTVAKHGNRAATSRAGSADVLEALGVPLDLSPERVGACIDAIGIGFMFARAHHPAMRHVAGARSEIGVRTLFNLLGPLSNPAGATHQLLGVSEAAKLDTMAHVLCALGAVGAWVVHGDGGLDEVSPSGTTRVAAVRNGRVERFDLAPGDFGYDPVPADALRGGDASHNAAIVRAVLGGERGPARDAVVINAAAALCVAGAVATPREGAVRAAHAVDSGAACEKLAAWVAFR
jgi:anthranilate phosphoribosyltransferase